MKRIILFRFHDYFDVCRNRIEMIKHFNPGVEVYGLYGGRIRDAKAARRLPLRDVYTVRLEDSHWKWKNGDLCVREWYKEIGRKVKFDMLHVWEWDLILLDSVDHFFSRIKEGVALTEVKPVSTLAKEGWCWVTGKLPAWDFASLKRMAKRDFGWNKMPVGGVFPGAAFSRKFLDKFARLEDVPSRCNDEVRLPLYAQSFGMKVQNSGFKIGDFFNCEKHYIAPAVVYANAQKGVKVFHPVKEKLNLAKLYEIR